MGQRWNYIETRTLECQYISACWSQYYARAGHDPRVQRRNRAYYGEQKEIDIKRHHMYRTIKMTAGIKEPEQKSGDME